MGCTRSHASITACVNYSTGTYFFLKQTGTVEKCLLFHYYFNFYILPSSSTNNGSNKKSIGEPLNKGELSKELITVDDISTKLSERSNRFNEFLKKFDLAIMKNCNILLIERAFQLEWNGVNHWWESVEVNPVSSSISDFFFYLGFLLQPFTNHRTAGEGGGHFLNSSLRLHLLHRHLDISWVITAESSPLHIGSSWTRIGNLWFPSASC